MLILLKSKEVMVQVTGVTRYGNWHTMVEIYNDIICVVKLLIVEKAFKEFLGRGLGDNAKSTNADLF